MTRYTGLETTEGTVPVVDLGSLDGVPDDIMANPGEPLDDAEEYLSQLPDWKVNWADPPTPEAKLAEWLTNDAR